MGLFIGLMFAIGIGGHNDCGSINKNATNIDEQKFESKLYECSRCGKYVQTQPNTVCTNCKEDEAGLKMGIWIISGILCALCLLDVFSGGNGMEGYCPNT